MNFLDRNPVELAQLDHLVDLELEAEAESQCRAKMTRAPTKAFPFAATQTCHLPAGHTGPCSWARDA